MRIAIIGSGVSGLVCAHLLHGRHDVVLYEADDRLGGHSHTHTVQIEGEDTPVDSGFLVYNERTYPLFCQLLDRLGIETQPTDMSFGVSDERTGLEWRGSSPSTVFAQPRNLVRPRFLAMLADIGRFNRLARGLLSDPPGDDVSLQDLLDQHAWSQGFSDWYLVPLGSSIWSSAPGAFTEMPAAVVARFFERHGLLSVRDQPSWRTVSGGSQRYVRAIARPLEAEGRIRLGSPIDKLRRSAGGVEVVGRSGVETFDHVIVATHSDQALSLLSDPDRMEEATLGAISYQPNRAILHTDARVMPKSRRAWASWNYHRLEAEAESATLTYYVNALQSIAGDTPLLVTLNREEAIDPAHVIAQMDYAHPVLDRSALAAQKRWSEINGRRRTWFCGAYWGYGFHEDGVRSAVEVCRKLGVTM